MQSTVQPGEVLLGKYRVERVLGQGGMGIVVAARHVQLGELFAIKMLLPDALLHAEAVERFLREARASAKLKGEHVARVHDVGSLENGSPYMVMEHLDGHDLKQVVKSRGGLPLDEVALYAYQACEAVAEAHANGIVHRDLKPANLFLIQRPNGTPCVKVLDFGISKELDATNSVGPDLTRTGAFLGSPLSMSPEQMANRKATDTRSDIWALGVILYELVVGKVPFKAQAVTELVTKVLTTSPTPPSHVRPDIPPAFDAIVLRCLEKRPEDRFQSVAELMNHLLPYAGGSMQLLGPARPMMASVATIAVASAQPIVQPRPELASLPATLVMATVPVERASQALLQSNSEASTQSITVVQNGVTAGAWGKTSNTPERKVKNGLVLGGVTIGLAVLIGVAFFATKSNTQMPATAAAPSNTTAATVAPLPSAVIPPSQPISAVTTTATNQNVNPAETGNPPATSATSATKVANTTSAKTAKSSPTPSPAQTKPATTATKKTSIADFND